MNDIVTTAIDVLKGVGTVETVVPATRKRKRETRERILEAATHVFAEKGYYGATMDDIVAASGISKGGLYFHFATKEAIFLALPNRLGEMLWNGMVEAMRPQVAMEDRMRAAVTSCLLTFEQHRDLTRVALVEARLVDPRADHKIQAITRFFAHVHRQALDRLVAEGVLPPQDTQLASYALVGTVLEIVLRWLMGDEKRPLSMLAPDLVRYNLRAVGMRI